MADISTLNYRVLSESVRKLPSLTTFLTDLFFGNRKPREAQTIDIDVIVGDKKLAPFVAPYQGATVVKKLGRQMSTVKAPKIRMKKNLPAEIFSERAAGATVYLSKEDQDSAKLVKIKEEQQDLKDKAVRRTEWMCAQALAGSINVEQEDGVTVNIDFGLPENNKPVLTDTALWSDTVNSDPLKNLRSWKRLVNQATGLNVTDIVLGSNASDAFQAHPKVLEASKADAGANGKITYVIQGKANYIGTYKGMNIWEDDEQYVDESGNTQNMVNANACILVAKSNDFELNFGAVEDLDAGGNVKTDFFSKMYKEPDPSAYWLLVESRPLPLPKRVESIVYAIVTEDAEE